MVERCREDFPIRLKCRCLAVSTSGYYGWRTRPPSRQALDNEHLLGHIETIHGESDGVLGTGRTWEVAAVNSPVARINDS